MQNVRLLSALFLAMFAPGAWTLDYPTRPVRLIVGLTPGAGTDITARDIAIRLTDKFKQTVLVDNRAGAGGSIAAEITAGAAPDGHTLMMATGTYLIHPLMHKARYDAVRDFAPVTQAVSLPLILVVNSAVPAGTLSELIALARGNPGTINFATAGSGSFAHLTGELFKIMARINLIHVPYKGSAAAYPDLLAGRVQMLFPSIASALPHIKTGRLRGLAVTTRTRSKSSPEYPSMDEAGVTGFDVTQWYGVLAPAGTPRPVINRLQSEIAEILRQPKFIAQLATEGSDPVANSPDEFAQYIRSEIDKWNKVIKQTGIRGE